MMSKIALISRVLDHLYPSPPIPLNHFDNFSLLVSVVLSAQTTDGKVNEVTKTLFEVAPTPLLMSAMEASEIQKIIQPVGLAPKKSVYLKKLSQMLLDTFDGEVPSSYESLESLPGVGHKTASVVMSQAFGESALAVDTHVHRLALRWGLSTDEKNVDKVQLALHSLFPEQHWNKVHLQMIYFGREYCTAKLHNSKECPICSWVNNKDGQPSISFVDFTPKKKSKGIVFYEDRITELKESPHLARGAVLFSPVKCEIKSEIKSEVKSENGVVKKVRKSVLKRVVKVKSDVKGEVNCDIEMEGEGLLTEIKDTKVSKKGRMAKFKVEMETEMKMEVKETPTTNKRKAKTLKLTKIKTETAEITTATETTEISQIKLELKYEDMKTPTKRMKKEKIGKSDENDASKTLDFSSPKLENKKLEKKVVKTEDEIVQTEMKISDVIGAEVKIGTRSSKRKVGI